MNWEDINDPSGEFDFHLSWGTVRGTYTPEEIQQMIDKESVEKMVHIVNEHFRLTSNDKPLMLSRNNGRKIVTER